jgi:hypothetical protein
MSEQESYDANAYYSYYYGQQQHQQQQDTYGYDPSTGLAGGGAQVDYSYGYVTGAEPSHYHQQSSSSSSSSATAAAGSIHPSRLAQMPASAILPPAQTLSHSHTQPVNPTPIPILPPSAVANKPSGPSALDLLALSSTSVPYPEVCILSPSFSLFSLFSLFYLFSCFFLSSI